jgi:hypothetical protein
MNVDPQTRLIEGSIVLEPLMSKYGFRFELKLTGKGSGGKFAVGEFRRDNRRVELHYRWGLGIVLYAIGPVELGHLNYMRRLGVYEKCRFASTQLDGTLDGFERLRDDLESYGAEFLGGTDEEFLALAAEESRPR